MISVISSRFDGCLDAPTLREKVTVRPQPVVGMASLSDSLAAEKLSDALKEIYIPNPFSIDFILEVVGRAAIYSAEKFDTEVNYVSRFYNPPEDEAFPLCLTGLAGVGKSQTINALRKVMPGPIGLTCDHFKGTQILVSHWYASARGKAGGRQLLADFLGEEISKSRINTAKLLVECRRRANRDGVSLVLLEEMQHISTGQGVAKVTEILLTMAGIGVPMAYVANYSLVHKLLNRNSEDKQRLLAEPRIMLPDAPDSETWNGYIEECIRVSNGWFCVGLDDLAHELYRCSFGIKRLVVQLIKLAYVEARAVGRKQIALEDIHKAYLSSSFFTNRQDVEELQRQSLQSKQTGGRLDLRCPFEIPMRSNVIQFARHDRDQRVISKVFVSSLNAIERSEYEALNPSGSPSNPKHAGSLPKRAPLPKPTDTDLADAYGDLIDSLNFPPKPR